MKEHVCDMSKRLKRTIVYKIDDKSIMDVGDLPYR